MGGRVVFSKWSWDNWIFTYKRMKLTLNTPSPLPKLITNDPTLKYDSSNYKTFLKVGIYLHDLGLGNGFSRWHQSRTKEKQITLTSSKLKTSCALKDTIIKVKERSTEWKKMFISYKSN